MNANKNGFWEDVEAHITDWMQDNEGRTLYGCDFATEATMAENMGGCWIVYRGNAIDYIREHWDEAADAFEYFKRELDLTPNPFEDPEAFTFYMLAYGVEDMAAYNEFLADNWNEEITLDRETIDAIKAGF